MITIPFWLTCVPGGLVGAVALFYLTKLAFEHGEFTFGLACYLAIVGIVGFAIAITLQFGLYSPMPNEIKLIEWGNWAAGMFISFIIITPITLGIKASGALDCSGID